MEEEDCLELDDVLTSFDYHFNHSYKRTSPEKTLLIAVLLHGVIDFLSPQKNKRWYEDAKDWFFKPEDISHPTSFINICTHLGIEPQSFKRNLLEIQHSPKVAIRIRKLLHLNPTSGTRNKIGVNSKYQVKKDSSIYD